MSVCVFFVLYATGLCYSEFNLNLCLLEEKYIYIIKGEAGRNIEARKQRRKRRAKERESVRNDKRQRKGNETKGEKRSAHFMQKNRSRARS